MDILRQRERKRSVPHPEYTLTLLAPPDLYRELHGTTKATPRVYDLQFSNGRVAQLTLGMSDTQHLSVSLGDTTKPWGDRNKPLRFVIDDAGGIVSYVLALQELHDLTPFRQRNLVVTLLGALAVLIVAGITADIVLPPLSQQELAQAAPPTVTSACERTATTVVGTTAPDHLRFSSIVDHTIIAGTYDSKTSHFLWMNRRAAFLLACAANDPRTQEAWARQISPQRRFQQVLRWKLDAINRRIAKLLPGFS